ncbi:MAG: molybdopterin-dependent oxidoreductase [Pyrinomonadaceae bacterium]|nr:molybdopterin-dependent oxidoreductase [Pyrinomonadaceae bacterium]
MIYLRRTGFALFLVALMSATTWGQAKSSPPIANDSLLNISGEIERPLKLTAADLAKLPRRTVNAKDHDGKETTFEGVELGEVLKLAGVKFGEEMRGKSLALFLVVEAADNYRAVFALPELDHGFTDRVILLADKRDGKALAAAEGPLRIVVPDEKRQGRWVRQVISLIIRRAQ